jgi:hypothetical protein
MIMRRKHLQLVTFLLSLSLLFTSCLDGIKGSGNVVRSERPVSSFESIAVSAGLEVILMQDSVAKVLVEADGNLQDIIRTEVSNGRLKIYPERRISKCTSKKIYVTLRHIHTLEVSSGAEVTCKMDLKMSSLQVSASSGADISLAVILDRLGVEASSGANLKLSGSAVNFDVDGSSGANIHATGVQSKICNAGVSSGAQLKLFVTQRIGAHASSGGHITVEGNPAERKIEKSSGGGVLFK